MKLVLKITRIGNSKGITIPKDILKKLGKDTGDYIEIELKEEK